ncbi:hypothetical protein GCM10009663_68750 [Kitasatospora arboriphila]|uniref:Uncharacterized protein n=1 Tax=Kitasatospora arboriphila TaxID=258052 RepID=A0ABP4ETB3_9ACTN
MTAVARTAALRGREVLRMAFSLFRVGHRVVLRGGWCGGWCGAASEGGAVLLPGCCPGVSGVPGVAGACGPVAAVPTAGDRCRWSAGRARRTAVGALLPGAIRH